MKEFYFGIFHYIEFLEKMINICYYMFLINNLVKKINRNNKLFFHLYSFTIEFTKKVLYRDKIDKSSHLSIYIFLTYYINPNIR